MPAHPGPAGGLSGRPASGYGLLLAGRADPTPWPVVLARPGIEPSRHQLAELGRRCGYRLEAAAADCDPRSAPGRATTSGPRKHHDLRALLLRRPGLVGSRRPGPVGPVRCSLPDPG